MSGSPCTPTTSLLLGYLSTNVTTYETNCELGRHIRRSGRSVARAITELRALELIEVRCWRPAGPADPARRITLRTERLRNVQVSS